MNIGGGSGNSTLPAGGDGFGFHHCNAGCGLGCFNKCCLGGHRSGHDHSSVAAVLLPPRHSIVSVLLA